MKPGEKMSFSWRDLFGGTLAYGSGDAALAGIRLLLLPVFTRILVPADFGLYAVLQVSVVVLGTLLPMGLPSAILVRFRNGEADRMKMEKDAVWAASLIGCLVFSTLAFSVFSGIHLWDSPLGGILPWFLLWATARSLIFTPGVSLKFRQRIARFNTARFLGILVSAASVYYLGVVKTMGLRGVIISEALGALVECGLMHLLDGYFPGIPSMHVLKGIMPQSTPLCAFALGVLLVDLSDRYVIMALLGKDATGLYAAAAKIAMVAAFAAEAFNSMWTPYYLRLTGEEGDAADRLSFVSRPLVILFFALVGFCTTLLPSFVDLRILGRPFLASSYHTVDVLVRPLAWVFFFKFCFYLITPAFLRYGYFWRQALMVYSALLLNLGGNVLVAKFGLGAGLHRCLYGMALITCLSYGFCIIFGWALVRREKSGITLPMGTIVVCACLGATLLFSPMWLSLCLSGCGVVVFGLILRRKGRMLRAK